MRQNTKTVQTAKKSMMKKQRWDWRKWLFVDEEKSGKLTARTVFNMIVLFFTIGCVFGTYWEEIQYIVVELVETGTLTWEPRRGLIYGPFSPIYGIGAVLIYLVFYLPRFRTWFCLVAGAVFGGVLEYALSWIQEVLFNTRSWDYSTYWLNIGGRTTIPFAIVWGMLVVLMARAICPFVVGVYRQLTTAQANKLCLAITLFLLFDAAMSIGAVYRRSQRDEGVPADNVVEEFFDENFDDEKMHELYPSTEEIED